MSALSVYVFHQRGRKAAILVLLLACSLAAQQPNQETSSSIVSDVPCGISGLRMFFSASNPSLWPVKQDLLLVFTSLLFVYAVACVAGRLHCRFACAH